MNLSESISRKLARAESALSSAREALAAAASEGKSAKELGRFVNSVAEAEGVLEVWALAEKIHSNGERGEDGNLAAVQSYLFSQLVQGADDDWSGRGNDVARARFDGLRSAAEDVQWL